MTIGLCTTDLSPAPAADLLGRISAMGFDAVQLAFGSIAEADFAPDGRIEIPPEIPSQALAAIRHAARGLELCAINGTYNMAHPDAAVRDEGARRFALLAAAAAELGVPVISLCSGTRNADDLWTPHPDNAGPAAWNDMMAGMATLCRIAERYGVTLLIETEASNVIDTPEKARRVMDAIGSPNLKVVLDAANLFHNGQALREMARAVIGHAFDVLGADIALAHGKDIAEGPGLQFCPTGRGIVDFAYMLERLRALDYAAPFVLHGIYDEKLMPGAARLIQELC